MGRRRTNSCSRQTLAACKPRSLLCVRQVVRRESEVPVWATPHIACGATVSRRELQKRRQGKTRPQSRPAGICAHSGYSLPGRSPRLHGPVPLLSLQDAVVVRVQPIEEVLSGDTSRRLERRYVSIALGTLQGKPWPQRGRCTHCFTNSPRAPLPVPLLPLPRGSPAVLLGRRLRSIQRLQGGGSDSDRLRLGVEKPQERNSFKKAWKSSYKRGQRNGRAS